MKKNGSTKAKARVDEEDGEEDVEHALLRVLRADLHHLLAVVEAKPSAAASSLMFALMNSTAR